jgi:hypothetical protein
MLQCLQLPKNATSATVAVCNLIKSDRIFAPAIIRNLATLLGSDFNLINLCLGSHNLSASSMKDLLQAISNTESRDPRDPTATATNFLNVCFSSCRDVSTALLLGGAAVSKTESRFCTNPAMALLWQHAMNSPRECFDSLIASLHKDLLRRMFGNGVTTCVLRSLLPAYVALCDQKTIVCEETMLAIPESDLNDCLSVQDIHATCSSQCAALLNKLSSGHRCFERMSAVQETVAQATNRNCADSGTIKSVTHLIF